MTLVYPQYYTELGNMVVLMAALLTAYIVVYEFRFIKNLFSDIFVPTFPKMDKKFIRFDTLESGEEDIGLERYNTAFFAVFLSLFIIIYKAILGAIFPWTSSSWQWLSFIVIISPWTIIFSKKNRFWLRVGVIAGAMGALIMGGLGNFAAEALQVDNEGGWLAFYGFMAGIFLVYSTKLVTEYPGNYHFLYNHRIFQNKSGTMVSGQKVSPVTKILNNVLNIYLVFLPLIMLNSLYGIFAPDSTFGQSDAVGDMAANIPFGGIENIIFAVFAVVVIVKFFFADLPLVKGMFQFRVFSILGVFQDVLEKSEDDETVIKGYDAFKKEYKNVTGLGDMLLFVLIFDAFLGFFVAYGTGLELFLPRDVLITVSAILKAEVYACIIIGVVLSKTLMRREKPKEDFFKTLQKSFYGDVINLRHLRMGEIEKFDSSSYRSKQGLSVQQWSETVRELQNKGRYYVPGALGLVEVPLIAKLLKRALTEHPENPDLLALQAKTLSNIGHNAKADKLFKELEEKHPDNLMALYYKGLHEYYTARYDQSEVTLKKVVAADAKFANAAYYLGRAHVDTNDYQSGFLALETAITANPKHDDALVKRARCHMELGRYTDAWNEVISSIEADINNLDVWTLAGEIAMHLGDTGVAEVCLNVSKPLEFGSQIWVKRLRALQLQGNEEQFAMTSSASIKFYTSVIEDMTIALEQVSRYAAGQAIKEAFEEVISVMKTYTVKDVMKEDLTLFRIIERLGWSYTNRGMIRALMDEEELARKDFHEAYRVYDKYNFLRPGSIKPGEKAFGFEDVVFRYMGDIYLERGLLTEAEDMYGKALHLGERLPIEYYKLGLAYMGMSEASPTAMEKANYLEKAIEIFDQGFEEAARVPSVQNRFIMNRIAIAKGRVLPILGGFEKTFTHFKDYLEMFPEQAQINVELGKAYRAYRKEDWVFNEGRMELLSSSEDPAINVEAAKAQFVEALRLNPDHEEAAKLLAQLS